jgi:hypothetical protein
VNGNVIDKAHDAVREGGVYFLEVYTGMKNVSTKF